MTGKQFESGLNKTKKMANPGKFQFMILSKIAVNHSVEILILKIMNISEIAWINHCQETKFLYSNE